MSQLSYNRLLALLCFVFSIGVISSCKKDNNNSSTTAIQLLSFGPTGAHHGDTIRFFGNNLNQVTEVDFTGTNAIVKQSDFKSQTSEQILLVVPQAAEKGYVTLKTPQGNIVTKTMFNLSVKASVTTMTKQARPGENVTLTGNYLNWVNSITFAKGKTVSTFVSKSINQLVVTVPADAQTGPLMIAYGGTDSTAVQTADTLKVTLPVITSVSPNPIKHQTNLTITGTDLDLAKKVIFSGVSTPVTTFISQSATQLVVAVPASTTSGKVTLEAASGVQTTSTADLTVSFPVETSMTPNPIDPGTNLTITGTNLDLVTSVSFQNAPAVTTFVSQSATQLVVKVPAGVLKGKLTFGVLNSSLTVQTNDVLDINGSVPPPTIAFPIYNDVITSNWNGWLGGGWGGTKDLANTSPVRDGLKSCRIDYVGGYGSPLQLGGASVSLAPYTTFKLSIYGAPGSGGKKVNVGLNGADSYTITLVEGKWTDYSIPLSGMTTATTLTDVIIKEYSGVGGFTIYVDDIGLN